MVSCFYGIGNCVGGGWLTCYNGVNLGLDLQPGDIYTGRQQCIIDHVIWNPLSADTFQQCSILATAAGDAPMVPTSYCWWHSFIPAWPPVKSWINILVRYIPATCTLSHLFILPTPGDIHSFSSHHPPAGLRTGANGSHTVVTDMLKAWATGSILMAWQLMDRNALQPHRPMINLI